MTLFDQRRIAWAILSRAALTTPRVVHGLLREHDVLKAAERLAAREYRSLFPTDLAATAEHDLLRIDRLGGRLLTRDDPQWPTALAGLDRIESFSPVALWQRGSRDLAALTERAVAVVGARAATEYGRHVADRVAGDLAADGWTIVSGGAFGIDAAAHTAALDHRGATVAVLAGGLHRLSPQGNAALLARVADTGLVASEYPPGVEPSRGQFLARNRIVAALAAAVVVCEAGIRSDTANTVDWAIDLGRPVAAVPGPIDSPSSRGCHEFIAEDRATLVTSADQVAALATG